MVKTGEVGERSAGGSGEARQRWNAEAENFHFVDNRRYFSATKLVQTNGVRSGVQRRDALHRRHDRSRPPLVRPRSRQGREVHAWAAPPAARRVVARALIRAGEVSGGALQAPIARAEARGYSYD